eukprot:NODE_7186_length_1601_cov_3.054274.p1 GENE.NODE_7186_length_1601_cov_3.054274~~NODE_7186_length_1601_cov_3.054274.p1  ORF type:complete len:428 (-),score=145.32 NODE_7186_length_1601_cov_3.054274:318-1532(-)
MPRRRSLPAWRVACCLVAFAAGAAAANSSMSAASSGTAAARRRLVVVTHLTEPNRRYAYLAVSALARGLQPRICGYGEGSSPDAKMDALRRFVDAEVGDVDIVLYASALDVLMLGGAAEILAGFEKLEEQKNRSVFFGAERRCLPAGAADVCDRADYPPSAFAQWRYLSAGALIGRKGAVQRMLQDAAVDAAARDSEQLFYQYYLKRHPDLVGLDTGCALLCVAEGIGGDFGVEVQGGRLAVALTGTSPAVVGFVGGARQTYWNGTSPTTDLYEVYRATSPSSLELFDVASFTHRNGGTHVAVWALPRDGGLRAAFFWLLRTYVCTRCRVAGLWDTEGCGRVGGVFSDMCLEASLLALLSGVLCSVALAALRGRRRGPRRRTSLGDGAVGWWASARPSGPLHEP